jgi:hypothetical protein
MDQQEEAEGAEEERPARIGLLACWPLVPSSAAASGRLEAVMNHGKR